MDSNIALAYICSGKRRLDGEEDEILYEAVLHHKQIKLCYIFLLIVLGIFFTPILCFLPICYFFYVRNWRLYLTRNGICATNHLNFIATCYSSLENIPIEGIVDIYVKQGTSDYVEARMKTDEDFRYFDNTKELYLLGPLHNPDEFVAAVKNVMASNGQA